jgi:hypothetical protein
MYEYENEKEKDVVSVLDTSALDKNVSTFKFTSFKLWKTFLRHFSFFNIFIFDIFSFDIFHFDVFPVNQWRHSIPYVMQ